MESTAAAASGRVHPAFAITDEMSPLIDSAKAEHRRTNYFTENEGIESRLSAMETSDEVDAQVSGTESRSKKGLGVYLGAMFLVGEMAGAGVLNLPKAIANTGWVGVPMLIILCVAVGFSGTRLARCWVILEERWPEYKKPCRRPYPAIAYRALGKIGQVITEVALNITLLGAATVYLLVTTQMISGLLSHLDTGLTSCEWVLILGGILIFPTWLGTPKDMWPASILAMTTTFLACLVVMVEVIKERGSHPAPIFPAPTVNTFFLGFGSILFALGGASIFPTVQNDMKNRGQFKHSVVITFLVLLSLYAPMTVVCYGILGAAVADNILMSVSGVAVTITEALISCHFIFAFIIVINPIMQTAEGLLNIPNRFSLRRCLVRTAVMLVVIILGLAVPNFSKILDLIGGSTVTLLSFVMPPVCYYKLATSGDTSKSSDNTDSKMSLKEKLVLFFIVVIGIIGGIASSWFSFKAILAPSAFGLTCFSRTAFFK